MPTALPLPAEPWMTLRLSARFGWLMLRKRYRINEATKQLGVDRTKLYKLIASGSLPACKRDGVTYIRAVDLEAYADGQSLMGGAQP